VRPLRIAHLVASLDPGGAELQELALAERLPRDRFRVDFLAVAGAGEYDARARAAGCRVLHIGVRAQADESVTTAQRRRTQMALHYARAARPGRYDIVDAWLYPGDVLAALGRLVTRTPVVISGRRNIQPHDRFGPFAGTVDRLVARLTDAVVANSTAAAEFAVRSHHTDPSKLRVIRNGVELIPPLWSTERSACRRRMGAGDEDFVIGCVGNYRDLKRHALLIDAFAALARERSDLRLVLVGEGPMRPHLERQVAALGLEGRVRLHGTELDPRPLYGAFDLVVQSSMSEGMPNVLLEAASAGRPLVATAAGGSGEIVVDGETGLLVPIEDLDALVGALRRAIDDPDLRLRLGASARAHVDAKFGMARYVREFGDLYEELADSKGILR
jgi:glycosyltransferase involved in cell wall biosynthesis